MKAQRSRGSVSVDMVLMTPVLMAMTVFAMNVGRGADTSAVVRVAADHGARAASMVARPSMVSAAYSAVTQTLTASQSVCDTPNIAVTATSTTVTVEVTCRISTGVARAVSVEVIDTYRGGS
jgi:Flp pilus assembly protein TadG